MGTKGAKFETPFELREEEEKKKNKKENFEESVPVFDPISEYQQVFTDAKLHENEFRFSRSQIDEMMQSFF